jgi:hypothetical protein
MRRQVRAPAFDPAKRFVLATALVLAACAAGILRNVASIGIRPDDEAVIDALRTE